jgi:hypothetical protein
MKGATYMQYTLRMLLANIKHTSWWKGKSIYTFETIEDLLRFIEEHIPITNYQYNFIIEHDKLNTRGNLACTSWYRVEKGEHQMTEYTSF